MPIIIISAAQLAQIGISPDYPENGSYILGNDIQIIGDWTPLPNLDGISFNGNGHRIYTLNAPLFSSLNQANISNLILNVAIDNSANNNNSGGLAQSATFTSLQNISVTGSINSNMMAGGICANINNTQMVNCHNYASVISQQDLAGGLAAFASDSSLINCVNNGAITANNDRSGGLVGEFQSRGISQVDGPPSKFYITDCVNNGPIQAFDYGGGLVGLLADDGFFLEHVNLGTDVRGCINRGNVSRVIGSPNGNDNIGGLAGAVLLDQPNAGGFFDCENKGNVSGGQFVGGIIGFLNVYQAENLEERNYQLNNCRNKGTITGTGPACGGIAGQISYSIVVNCVNQGIVSGTDNCGGIAGTILNGMSLIDNKNCAAIMSTGQFVGGIAGLAAHNQENGAITTPNEIRDNLVSCPSISGTTSVYRVLGGSADSNFTLLNTKIFPDILLSGNNSPDGGLIYNNQPVAANDPQLGPELRQGATLVCPPGEHLKNCVGCVPGHLPCPCGECSCLPGRCRPCNGEEGPCLSQEHPQKYSLSSISTPLNGNNRIPSQILRS